MAIAKTKAGYTKEWKNHVTEILYGPVMDIGIRCEGLDSRMRETVSELCRQIDEVGVLLEQEGTFSE